MYIEVQEQPDPHVLPRRLYVNICAIAYVSAASEGGPAVLTFAYDRGPTIPLAETFETVQHLIDAAVSGEPEGEE